MAIAAAGVGHVHVWLMRFWHSSFTCLSSIMVFEADFPFIDDL